MKEITVSYKDYKNSNKYSTLKKKNDSYNADNKTIILLLDEYEEKAMEYLENNEDDRNISEIATSIKYHIEFTTEEELLQRIENKIDDIEGEDEEESWVKEQKLHIQLFRYILEKRWLNFEEVTNEVATEIIRRISEKYNYNKQCFKIYKYSNEYYLFIKPHIRGNGRLGKLASKADSMNGLLKNIRKDV